MKEYIKALKNYFNFKDRASRRDYWMFFLFHILIAFGIGIIIGFFKLPTLIADLYMAAILIPSIAAGVRRMHDVSKSGWFILIPLYNLYLAVQPGDKEPNRFGPASVVKPAVAA